MPVYGRVHKIIIQGEDDFFRMVNMYSAALASYVCSYVKVLPNHIKYRREDGKVYYSVMCAGKSAGLSLDINKELLEYYDAIQCYIASWLKMPIYEFDIEIPADFTADVTDCVAYVQMGTGKNAGAVRYHQVVRNCK